MGTSSSSSSCRAGSTDIPDPLSPSLMSSSRLLQQCPACLVSLAWTVFVMRGRWPYRWCLVGCCFQDLFSIARNILVQMPSSFFSSRLVSVQVVHTYSSIDTTSFSEVPSSVEMSPVWFSHIYSVLCTLTWRPMPVAARSKLCSSVSAWLGVFASIARSST